jgi:hypothetical protein
MLCFESSNSERGDAGNMTGHLQYLVTAAFLPHIYIKKTKIKFLF